MLFLALFIALAAAQYAAAQYADANCAKLKCTEAEMYNINYGKAVGLGSYACNNSYTFFNRDMTVNSSFVLKETVSIRYNESNGAYTTKSGDGRVMAEEFCDGDGGVCIVDYEPYLAGFHGESYTVSRGEIGNAARLIQSYEKNNDKRIRRVQHFMAQKEKNEKRAKIVVWIIDENNNFLFSGLQDCLKTGN